MAAVDRDPGKVEAPGPPELERISDGGEAAVRREDGERRTGDAMACIVVGTVVVDVDRRACAMILAGGMQMLGW